MSEKSDLIAQKQKFREVYDRELKEGDVWMVLGAKWWGEWKSYVNFDSVDGDPCLTHFPGQIDNSDILDERGQVRNSLVRPDEIDIVSRDAWDLLHDWYGTKHSDTTVFRRKVIKVAKDELVVEMNPPIIRFQLENGPGTPKMAERTLSRLNTVAELEDIARKMFSLNSKQVSLLMKTDANEWEPLNKRDLTLEDMGTQEIRVRCEAEKLATSSSGTKNTNYELRSSCSGGYSSWRDKESTPGVCGLSNLGNTCFMNSALQCLSNVYPLTVYFLRERKSLRELNRDNRMGSGGKIASEYYDLINLMWSGKSDCAAPRDLKMAISSFAPQFTGYAQHDSHELMVFVLDGLHEDLNRIKKKPYVKFEFPDRDPEEKIAEDSWHKHLQRNDSVIVDLFHGQLRSKVTCPTCKFESVTFDPYSSLSLPLPHDLEYYQAVQFVAWGKENTSSVGMQLRVTKNMIIGDLLNILAQEVPPSPGKILIATEVYNRIRVIFPHSKPLADVSQHDNVIVYEVPEIKDTIAVAFNPPEFGNSYHHDNIPLLLILELTPMTYDIMADRVISQLTDLGVLDPPQTEPEPMEEGEAGSTPTSPVQEGGDAPMVEEDDEHPKDPKRCPIDEDTQRSNWPPTDSSKYPDSLREPPFTVHLVERDSDRYITSYGRERLGPDNRRTEYSLGRNAFYDITIKRRWESRSEVNFKSKTRGSLPSLDRMPPLTTGVDLYRCFDLFTLEEQLKEPDTWYCRKCEAEREATKKFDLWMLPDILVLQLKRFRCSARYRNKVNTFVSFPRTDLDLTKWVKNPAVNGTGPDAGGKFLYDLVAVSNHSGGLGGGHYTTFALNDGDRKWYDFNDSWVSSVDSDSIVTSSAYVLIYVRQGKKIESHPREALYPSTELVTEPNVAKNGASANDQENTAGAGSSEDVD